MKQLSAAIQQLVSSDDSDHAERWYSACVTLINSEQPSAFSSVDPSLSQRKRQVLIHGFGRAKGLLDAALLWPSPRIGHDSNIELADVRGELWRYVMAYSGWELVAKSTLWHENAARDAIHSAFDAFLDQKNSLQPPFLSKNQAPQKLQQWLAHDARNERSLPAFLGLNKQLKPFPRWLVSESTALTEQRVLAAMRHIVAHGALSPTKAVEWGLRDLYAKGSQRLKLLTCRTAAALTELV